MELHSFVKVEPFKNEDVNNSISELFACRVCLDTDSKLFDLHKNQLADVFEELTGNQITKSDGLPQYICYICRFLLHKSAVFRSKCRKANVLLHDVKIQQPLMTTEYIKKLDRSELKLRLTFTNALNIYFPSTTVSVEPNLVSIKNQNLIKNEPLMSIDDTSDDCNESDDIHQEFIEISELKTKLDETVKENCDIVTNERKKESTNKLKNKKEIVKRKARKQEETIEKEKKIKRPCNKKYIEDFVGFSETYNCEVVFLTKEQQVKEVEERKETNNYKKARYKCDLCYTGFMSVSAHEKHIRTHDKAAGDHICDVCHMRYPIKKRLLLHRLRNHNYRFICKSCNHASKVSTKAKAHFKWHEGFKYECKECNKKFNVLSTHVNHNRRYHSVLTCEACKEVVSGTKGLEEHNLREHSEKYPCETCRKQFENHEALERHSRSGICSLYNCPCPKCGENFQNKHLLNDHKETEHNETLYRCEECPSAYHTGRELAAHWTIKHSEPKYMCEVCARSYTSSSALNKHLKIHAGGKPRSGSGSADSSQNKLRNQRINSEEKPFQCPVCHKRFRLNFNLKIHMNTHTGERPFKCKLCDEAFKSCSQKHKHVLMVHKKERRHKCHMCDKTYVMSFDLKMHIRTFHMKIPLPPPNRRKSRNKQAANK